MSIFPHFLMMGVRCLFFHSSITSKTNGQNMLSVKEIDKLYSKEIHNVLLVTTTKVFLSFFLSSQNFLRGFFELVKKTYR